MSNLGKIGQDLLDMGQKLLDAHKTGDPDEKEEKEKMGTKIDLPSPKRAVIIASLKRKIGE